MPNRTEILHFRATPEEKETIRENAGHAELALSEWMRQRSLRTEEDRWPDEGLMHPKPPVAQVLRVTETHEPFIDPLETYEQFMERRVPELLGQDVDAGDVESAQWQARAEWAANES